jgi:hypothetical protein
VPKVFPNAENRDAKKLVLTAESSTKSDSISIDLKWPAYKKTEVKMISLGLVGAKITYKTLGTDGNFIRRPGTYLLQYRKSRTSSWKTIDKDSSQGRGKFLLTVGLDGWYRIINPVGNVIHDAYWAYSV